MLNVFALVNRSRKYIIGVSGGVPLPLTVGDISTVLEAHPSPLPRDELDSYIFRLDEEFLETFGENPKKGKPAAQAWGDVVATINAG